ncbi:uncharacterized protein TrAtP1_009384 [Trichoderma atroviride]|uniref:uncharacterized protein n=1 Tax=Hypocrea atroviridis TaxID=63577 RepID=UPI00332BE405|nr:hypothetical protein TrAtP1_009384 [Trichoderma atroviride]
MHVTAFSIIPRSGQPPVAVEGVEQAQQQVFQTSVTVATRPRAKAGQRVMSSDGRSTDKIVEPILKFQRRKRVGNIGEARP